MDTASEVLLMFDDNMIFPPPGSEFRITDASQVRITDSGESRITDA